ncbi:MAG TPA: hypothetical protein VN947_15215 [Polyangia bacterium]|nr:hypothetical protein [Polyangia bacterium]
MWSRLTAVALLFAAGCSTMSVLSKSRWEHQQRQYELVSQGQYEAAAAEKAAVEHARDRMAKIGNSAEPPYPRL